MILAEPSREIKIADRNNNKEDHNKIVDHSKVRVIRIVGHSKEIKTADHNNNKEDHSNKTVDRNKVRVIKIEIIAHHNRIVDHNNKDRKVQDRRKEIKIHRPHKIQKLRNRKMNKIKNASDSSEAFFLIYFALA